jgi:hypothetical protein
MSMAAVKPASSSDPNELVPFNFRMPRGILDGLDAWVHELNSGRAIGKVTRSDLIRILLSKALEEHPDLNAPPTAK